MKQPVPSQWKLGGLSPLMLAKRVGKSIPEDNLSGESAELAYYFFLAIFPLLLFAISLLGFFAAAGPQLRANLMSGLAQALPPSASALVDKTVNEIVKSRGSGKIIFGLLGALWSASAGMSAIMETLNVAYHVKEKRSYLRTKAIAIALTIASALLVLFAFVLLLYGGKLANLVSAQIGAGSLLADAWKIAQWPVLLAAMFLSYSLVFYFGPNLEKRRWTWISPGATAGLVLWLAVSFGLRVYLHYFNSYNKTYGSLGAVAILMLWLYLSGFALLLGGEINSAIAQAEVAQEKQKEEYEARHRKVEREIENGFEAA